MKKYLDYAGLQRLVALIKSKFVQKEEGKGLSEANYTVAEKEKLGQVKTTNATTAQDGTMAAADKQKLDGIATGAEVNTIIQVKRNGSIVNPQARVVDIKVPVKLSELTNDRAYQTRTEVQQLINAAGHMKKEIVATLPQVGKDNVLYLKGPKTGATGNIYEEFIWVAGKWELVGNTETQIDLSGYLQKSEVATITNQEIEQMVNGG